MKYILAATFALLVFAILAAAYDLYRYAKGEWHDDENDPQ